MTVNNNQGNRPNYQSSIQPLTYISNKETLEADCRNQERMARHENFIGGAYRDLGEITERESCISE